MNKYIISIIVLIFLAGTVYLIAAPGKPGVYDSFATCLKDKGATFYGAFWCPHCQTQKARFGKSAKLLPYIECSTPDGQGQLQACKDKGINTYPTWEFPTATSTPTSPGVERVVGEIELVDLAKKTSCPLPQ